MPLRLQVHRCEFLIPHEAELRPVTVGLCSLSCTTIRYLVQTVNRDLERQSLFLLGLVELVSQCRVSIADQVGGTSRSADRGLTVLH